MERVIFHCDLNSFYASVELLDHPELRHLPVAVCGDPESRHGIILAKNEPAKRFQVQTAETIWQAKRKCPDLVLLPAHHRVYRDFSRRINRMYQDYTDLVEPFGIDESWLDVSGTLHLFGGDPGALADELRRRMRQEFGLTISVGVSFNKVFAKLGSDYKKPDATTWITRENFQQLVWPLPVGDLLYVGRAAAETMKKFGVRTIGDLAHFNRESLFRLLGRHGAQLHDYANGLDRAPVAPAGQYTPPKSVGSGNTFARNLTGREEFQAGVGMLAGQVAARLRRHGMKCTGVALQIRDPDFRDLSRQKRLEVPTCLGREIARAAMELAEGCWTMERPSSRRRRPPPSRRCSPAAGRRSGRVWSGWPGPRTPSGPNTDREPSGWPLSRGTPPGSGTRLPPPGRGAGRIDAVLSGAWAIRPGRRIQWA